MAKFLDGEWNRALELQLQRLEGKKYVGVLRCLSYESFQTSIEEADRLYARRNIARHVTALEPSLAHLNSFVAAITSIVQGTSPIAGFIWGLIQMIIVMASRFAKIMKLITDMIENLTFKLDTVKLYLEQFPDSKRLHGCASSVILAYVRFCISALKFLTRQLPIYTLLRMLWSTIEQEFQRAKEDIDKQIAQFESAGQQEVNRTLVVGLRGILATPVADRIEATEPSNNFYVDYKRNDHFCGREDDLEHLHRLLTIASTSLQKSCVIHGIGGVGKTAVAIEYTYRFRRSYDCIFWIRAETELGHQECMAGLAQSLKLDLPETGNTTNRGAASAVRKWLETTDQRWLVVFDNAEEWAILKPYWPRSTRGSIIVTSQDPQFAQTTSSEICLKPFDRADGSKLLLRHLRKDESSTQSTDARRISDELGGLPLAIAHVAGYLAESRASLGDCLELLKERRNSARIFSIAPPMTIFQYEKTLGTVWDVALQRLDRDALTLIQVLSMMNPDGVPEDMLRGDHREPELAFLDSGDVMRFQDMIRVLGSRQLVERVDVSGKPCLIMHRSLQRTILHRLDTDFEKFQDTFNMAFILIRKVFPRQSPVHGPQNDLWGVYEQYRSHVMNLRAVYMRSVRRPLTSMEFAEILSDAAYYFWERNIFIDGLRASDTAEEICEKFPSQFKNKRANVHTIASAIRWNRGISERRGCLRRFLKSLSLRQQLLNELNDSDATMEDLALYANAWNDVGCSLLDYECYEDAVPYFDLSIALKRKLGDNTACLESLKNKALALTGQGRFVEAIELIPDEASLPQDVSEPAYVHILQVFQFTWACILLNAGDLKKAHEKLTNVLACRRNLYGESGRSTLDACYMLAIVKQKMGNYENSVILLKTALETPEEWSDESIARAQYSLGRVLHLMGQGEDFRAKAQAHKWIGHADYPSIMTLDSDQIYDHIVSIEAGRSTMGHFRQGGRTPRLTKICLTLNERLSSTGNGVLTAAEVSEICRKCIPNLEDESI